MTYKSISFPYDLLSASQTCDISSPVLPNPNSVQCMGVETPMNPLMRWQGHHTQYRDISYDFIVLDILAGLRTLFVMLVMWSTETQEGQE